LYNFHQIYFCGWNVNLCKVSATLYHARKTWKAKTRNIWIVNIMANETTHDRCYSISSTEKGRLRPLSNDVQPRVACWSSGMILALVLEVPVPFPDRPFLILFCQWKQHHNETDNFTMVFVTPQRPYETTEYLSSLKNHFYFCADNSKWPLRSPSRLKYDLTNCLCWPGNISNDS